MTFHAVTITLFPEMFPGPLGLSLAGRALTENQWRLSTVNIRDHGLTKHRQVDDTPYGGGPGMVMRADVIDAALEGAHALAPDNTLLFMSPRGTHFSQEHARTFSASPGVSILCGRFEGVDERVLDKWREKSGLAELSIGDYILSGGELAALTVLDAVVRLLPGVMGNEDSGASESFSEPLLEYPQYTRPHSWDNKIVPDVLLSGDHQKIAKWRQEQAEGLTKKRRPDLWQRYISEKR